MKIRVQPVGSWGFSMVGRSEERGTTLVELVISLTVLAIVILSVFSLFVSLVQSTIVAKQKSVALTLATNQIEYLRGLPYDSLAVAGGSIYSTNPLPASKTQKLNGISFTIKTSVNYVDDAYDGCASYPTQALKQLYCRNYPAPAGAPAIDSNPQDYKVIHVSVYNYSTLLSQVDTQVAARVAETSSTTGAMLVTIIDDSGNPVSGATVSVVDTTLAPAVNLSDSSDSNGVAIFYGLPPDSNGYDYVISATKTGLSSLTTIAPSGSLQPTYASQHVIAQQSSFVTLTLRPQGANSLLVETTDTSGNPLAGVKVYAKGGYKQFTATTDTTYYYDNVTPSDTRPTTDATGLINISNLTPGPYYFCGDAGATSCTVGGTTYYLAAALPYVGTGPFSPVTVPTFDASNPPATTYPYGGNSYIQKVRLLLTTDSTFPRITTITPTNISLSGGTLATTSLQVTGANLPCSSTAASCSTTVKFTQGSNTYTASCTGTTGTSLNCTVNLTGVTAGTLGMIITANGRTLTTPSSPMIGGLVVLP